MGADRTATKEECTMKRELIADYFTSLDGFAAGPDGTQNFSFACFGPETMHYIDRVLSSPHIIVMGRKTYEHLGAFWPSAETPQAPAMNTLPKLVFSRTLSAPLSWSNARLSARGLTEEITALKAQDGPPLRVIGSLEITRQLLEAGLVDRVRLMIFPVALGKDGTESVFGSGPTRPLELISNEVLDGRTMVVEYRPVPH